MRTPAPYRDEVLGRDALQSTTERGHTLSRSGYLLTQEEVGKIFRVSGRTIQRWSQQHLIPSVKIGRTRRYDVENIRRSLNSSGMIDPELRRLLRELEQ